jgi:hypothetical protein
MQIVGHCSSTPTATHRTKWAEASNPTNKTSALEGEQMLFRNPLISYSKVHWKGKCCNSCAVLEAAAPTQKRILAYESEDYLCEQHSRPHIDRLCRSMTIVFGAASVAGKTMNEGKMTSNLTKSANYMSETCYSQKLCRKSEPGHQRTSGPARDITPGASSPSRQPARLLSS